VGFYDYAKIVESIYSEKPTFLTPLNYVLKALVWNFRTPIVKIVKYARRSIEVVAVTLLMLLNPVCLSFSSHFT
jgi:hypothetical protein